MKRVFSLLFILCITFSTRAAVLETIAFTPTQATLEQSTPWSTTAGYSSYLFLNLAADETHFLRMEFKTKAAYGHLVGSYELEEGYASVLYEGVYNGSMGQMGDANTFPADSGHITITWVSVAEDIHTYHFQGQFYTGADCYTFDIDVPVTTSIELADAPQVIVEVTDTVDIEASTIKIIDSWLNDGVFYWTLYTADSAYIIDLGIQCSSSGTGAFPMERFELDYFNIVLNGARITKLDTISAVITKDNETNMMQADFWVVAKGSSTCYHIYGSVFGPVQDFYEMDSQEPITLAFNESDLTQFTDYIEERGQVYAYINRQLLGGAFTYMTAFNVAALDEDGHIPAGTYAINHSHEVGTAEKNMGFDTDNESEPDPTAVWSTDVYNMLTAVWLVTRGTITISYDADGKMNLDMAGYNFFNQEVNVTYTGPATVIKEGEVNPDEADYSFDATTDITYTFTGADNIQLVDNSLTSGYADWMVFNDTMACELMFVLPTLDNDGRLPEGPYVLDASGMEYTVFASYGYDAQAGLLPSVLANADIVNGVLLGDVWYMVSGMVDVSYDAQGNLFLHIIAKNSNGVNINVTYDQSIISAVDDIRNTPAATKQLRDGQVLIIRDGKTFNAQGVEIR